MRNKLLAVSLLVMLGVVGCSKEGNDSNSQVSDQTWGETAATEAAEKPAAGTEAAQPSSTTPVSEQLAGQTNTEAAQPVQGDAPEAVGVRQDFNSEAAATPNTAPAAADGEQGGSAAVVDSATMPQNDAGSTGLGDSSGHGQQPAMPVTTGGVESASELNKSAVNATEGAAATTVGNPAGTVNAGEPVPAAAGN